FTEVVDQQAVPLPEPIDKLTDFDFPRVPLLVAVPLPQHGQLDEDLQQFTPIGPPNLPIAQPFTME
ncbi:MAG: hypothetical protein ACLQO6_13385, partial [Desulfomonilaceae bacterium]